MVPRCLDMFSVCLRDITNKKFVLSSTLSGRSHGSLMKYTVILIITLFELIFLTIIFLIVSDRPRSQEAVG